MNLSNIIIYLDLFFFPNGECQSNIHSREAVFHLYLFSCSMLRSAPHPGPSCLYPAPAFMAKMKQGETSKAVKQLNKEQEASKLRQAKRSCSRSHFIIERTFVPNLMLNTTSAWRWHMSVCHCRDEMCIIQRQQPTWRNQSHLFHANNLHCCSVVTEEN